MVDRHNEITCFMDALTIGHTDNLFHCVPWQCSHPTQKHVPAVPPSQSFLNDLRDKIFKGLRHIKKRPGVCGRNFAPSTST